MYTEQDYADIRRQVRRRLLGMGVPALFLLGAVAASFVFRLRWLTVGLTILLGCFCVFFYGLLIQPVMAYQRRLEDVLFGRTRDTTGVFKGMEEKTALRDGVEYYPFLLNVGDKNAEEDDRLFYYDANLPRPDWRPGDRITVTSHEKALGGWTRA